MWWAVSSIPSPAFCPTPSTTTKSPLAHAPVTVSAKRQNQYEDGLPQSVIKSNTPSVVNTPISKNPKQLKGEYIDSEVSQEDIGGLSGGVVNSGNPKESSDSEEKAGVGGSDILWALYKASAKKTNKVVKKREIPANKKIKDGNGKEEDYYRRNNVKPLRIRSDWSSRLDDLERRLKELIDS